ncbi:MAG: hypothetical protein PHO26_02590 [Dehalococcoidia bacterium]|nr:hypothetical protein [Dehalococcoidia bacterium]MDD5493794.1 hypothetical protein [Dehalococcoidia bacterium]
MTENPVKIYSIMACNVYWDFEGAPTKKEQHKFLVSFFPGDAVVPDLVEKISAYGPDGYTIEFKNQMFKNTNLNGWIYDRFLNFYWYMINLPTGFIKEGQYTIEVKCKDGSVERMSRMQKNAISDAMVSAYLKNRDRILNSFKPSRVHPMPASTPLKDVGLGWLTLKDVAGLDAYYVTRLAEGATTQQIDTQKLVWWDNIYLERLRKNDPRAGFNRGAVTVTNDLKPGKDYGYFVEITDGNIAQEANICIFQPFQFFQTPVNSPQAANVAGT